MELPIYRFEIKDDDGDETGVTAVSLVDEPAIERTWKAFKKVKSKYNIESEEKRIVSGPFMIANLPIYRRDADGEYYAVFDRDTIELIRNKFMRNGWGTETNTMHEDNHTEKVYMVESFIVDQERGISVEGYGSITDGSWFGTYKVDDDDIWAKVKDGTFTGFSVEGIFEMAHLINTSEDKIDRIRDAINGISDALSD